jgi:hypothetical protein
VLGHLGYKNADIKPLAALISYRRLDVGRSIPDFVSPQDIG